jgi:hypothetical protein
MRELGKLNEWSDTFLIIKYGRASRNKVKLIKLFSDPNDSLTRLINPTIHINDQLMLKSNLNTRKETAKVLLESLK